MAIKRFLYVEDGSVDVDLLQEELAEDTKIIVYRQGAQLPQVKELAEPAKDCYDSWYERQEKDIEKLKHYIWLLEKATNTKKRADKVFKIFMEAHDEYGIKY